MVIIMSTLFIYRVNKPPNLVQLFRKKFGVQTLEYFYLRYSFKCRYSILRNHETLFAIFTPHR